MLTYATIAAGSPSSMGAMTRHMLTQTVPKEVADLARYYTRGIEIGEDQAAPRPDMHPIVARGLGVDPEKPLDIDQINALLSGHRADGEKIEGKNYQGVKTYIDKDTGERKESVPIGSVDFCLTPDKSVSVAWAFAAPAEQAAIYQAHRDAAHEAMRYVERHMAFARKGHGGQDGADQGHLCWISFDHFTSRPTLWVAREENGERISESIPIQLAGDPDLHTHFTVMNAVFCENGRVGSMDLDRLNGFIKEAGAVYQAFLAQALKDIGAEVILDPETGAARLVAIPEYVRDHYSKKTMNGEEAARIYAKKLGLDWDTLPEERRHGLLKTGVQGLPTGLDQETRGKLRKDDMANFVDWKRQADEIDWEHETIITQSPQPEIPLEVRQEIAYEQFLPWFEKDANSRAVVSEHDLRAAVARGYIAGGIRHYTDIDRGVELAMERGVRQYGQETTLIIGQEAGKKSRSVSTALHERHEKEFIRKAKAAAADRSDALPHDRLEVAVKRSGLDVTSSHGQAQLNAIYRLGEGGKVGVMIGAAGAGKTTLVRPLVSAWKEQGRTLHGIALAWRQADDWIKAGIDPENAKAISVFLQAVEKKEISLNANSVVVVDEISLLGTKQGLDLLRLQEEHGFRLVMIGDDKQCQAIEAGPIIELARKALGDEQVPEILTTVRQQTERERDIAGLFRDGKAGFAIAMKREDGTAELVPGGYREAAERTAVLVAERLKANASDPDYKLTVSAPTNMDAHNLSMEIRKKRREMGQIGRDAIRISAADRDGNEYQMALAAGDKVRLYSSARAQGERGSIGRNGTILSVLEANRDGIRVRNPHKREGFIPWKTLMKDGRVRLAYGEVQTTHTAQGSTVTEHIYAMPAGTKMVNGFSAYSSGTRHEQKSFMVISDGAERNEVKHRRPLNDCRLINEEDVWANVGHNLSRQPTKATAMGFLDKAYDVKRGTARSIQRGIHPIEQRERQGLEPTTLGATLQHRQEDRYIVRVAERIDAAQVALMPVMEGLAAFPRQVNASVEIGVEQVTRSILQNATPNLTRQQVPEQRQNRRLQRAGAKAKRQLQKVVQRVAKERIPQDHIKELKRSISLTGLIGQSVKLDHHGKGLCPFHEEKTPSFHVDDRKGTFHCFGCGAHGDAVNWLRGGLKMPFPDAIAYLGGKTGKELPKLAVARKETSEPSWVAVNPIPEGAPALLKPNGWSAEVFNPKAAEDGRDKVSSAYRPAHVAQYRDSEGRDVGYVLRVEMPDGGKFTPQITWAVPREEIDADPLKVGRWCLTVMNDPRPMYHAERLAQNPDAVVIIVMGEKKADALQKELGDSVIVLSWAGGDNARGFTDFSPLKGRDVIIWPDADHSGRAAAVGEVDQTNRPKPGVVHLAEAAGANSIKVIVPPDGVEKGWDSGDLIKSGSDRQQLEAFIAERAVSPADAKRVFDRHRQEAPERTQPRSVPQPTRGPSIER